MPKTLLKCNLRHECQTFCRFHFHLQVIYVFSMLIWAQTSVQNNLKKKNKKLPNFISQTILLPHQNPISLKIWQRFFQISIYKTILLPQQKPISWKIWQKFCQITTFTRNTHLSKNLTILPYSTKAQISQNSEQKSAISSPLSMREREREHRKKSFEQQVVSTLKNSESKNPSPETQNMQKDFSKWQQNTKNIRQSRQCTMSSTLE